MGGGGVGGREISMMLRLTLTITAGGMMQVLSIVTVAVSFVAMAGSIFGMNLYFNVADTPPVSSQAYVLSGILSSKLGGLFALQRSRVVRLLVPSGHHNGAKPCLMLRVVCVMSPGTSLAVYVVKVHVCQAHMFLQVAFWTCAMSIVVVGLAIMLVVMGFARHKRLLFIPKAHLVH